MNGLSDFDETYWGCSIACNDDVVRLWKSNIRVTADIEGICVDIGASTYI